MVFFNHATRQMTAKIVYYGPGLCGKTTNLNTIYGKTSPKARGEMVSLNTETDRTLFFDLLPLDVGVVGGFKTKLQLYTVPGQVFYNSTRKLVLKGVDGIVFVADSQSPMLDANKESLQNLEENLRELGLDLREIPMVFQWNKRDLKNTVPVNQLEEELNPRRLPTFQSIASDGTGVFETLRGVTKLVLANIKTNVLGETTPTRDAKSVAAKDAPKPPPEQPPLPEPIASAPPLEPVPVPPVAEVAATPAPVEEPLPSAEITQQIPPEPVPERSALAPPPKPLPTPVAAVPATPRPPAPLSPRPAPHAPGGVPHLPSLPRMLPPAPAVPRAPLAQGPKAAASALLGNLTHAGLLGSPSVLRMTVPGDVDGQELDVVVQVRLKGQTIAEGNLKKPAPGKGIVSKLTLELKRG